MRLQIIFDQLMTLDASSRKDILWWISHLDSEYSLIKITAPSIILCTDASLDGREGHIVGGRSTGGRWTIVESGNLFSGRSQTNISGNTMITQLLLLILII